jgi:F0F1-type ATP synthase membrane subunit a
MLKAPLEQFQILSLFTIKIFNLDFSITNFLLINLLALTILSSLIYFNNVTLDNNPFQKTSVFFNPNSWQRTLEYISEASAQLISDIITTDNEKYFPIISVVFNFILFSNLIGLIPYTFTATSHVIITFTYHFLVFLV